MHFVQRGAAPAASGAIFIRRREVRIPPLGLGGVLSAPDGARALVLFAHGSGSSRFSPRNVQAADGLNRRGLATLLFDLLQREEADDRSNIFDVRLQARRLVDAVRWVHGEADVGALPIGLFGASTGAAAALIAAAALGPQIGAVVSRGGRPDLANGALERVAAPTLLIVGSADEGVLELNQCALERLRCAKALKVIPGATHLFPEPGALDAAIDAAAGWFARCLFAAGQDAAAAPAL